MSNDASVPEWLRSARERVATEPVSFPEVDEWPLRVEPGEIRAARDMDGDAPPRLVLILESSELPQPWANALLLSPIMEAATERDILLTGTHSALPFDVIVETDIAAPLFWVQLGPRLGAATAAVLFSLRASTVGQRDEFARERAGLPLTNPGDPRWRLKEYEVEVMQRLGSDCLDLLVMRADDRAAQRPVLDPELLVQDGDISPERLRELLTLAEVASRVGVEIPPDALIGEKGLQSWLGSLPEELVRALAPLLNEALVGSPAETAKSHDVDWKPERPHSSSAQVDRCIAERAHRGVRAVRLLTRRHGPLGGGAGWATKAAHVGGVGVVQVTEWLLEEAA